MKRSACTRAKLSSPLLSSPLLSSPAARRALLAADLVVGIALIAGFAVSARAECPAPKAGCEEPPDGFVAGGPSAAFCAPPSATEACSFVQDCDFQCDVNTFPCYQGPEDPSKGLWVCNDDDTMTQWTAYPLWCCKDCEFGRASCESWKVNYGVAVHQTLCPTENAVQEDVYPSTRTCGEGICQANWECDVPGEPPTCTPLRREPFEDCFNGLDDNCNGTTDCEDPECQEPAEDCYNGVDDNCDGSVDCDDPACSELPEICFDGVDDNCDPSDDGDPYRCYDPDDDPPNNGKDENGKGGPDEGAGPGKCDDCGPACRGAPVHLRTRQMYVGPHEDVHVQSDNGGSFDLLFARVYDSDRAARDQKDDARPGVGSQHPFPRPFGPGWRHSYDDRLILRGDGAPEEPLSVVYDHAMGLVRLFPTGPGTFGRAPGRAVALEKDGSTWQLTLESGDVLLFVESDVATKNHPWGAFNPAEPEQGPQYHLRLFAIHPMGVPGYRVRVWHEQDSDVPAGVCSEMPGGACLSSRGLLVAVAIELMDEGSWRRGASLHLRWRSLLVQPHDIIMGETTKDQYLLTGVVDGVDVDRGVAEPEVLVEYSPAVERGQLYWRRPLGEVRSGLGGQQAAPGALIARLSYDAAASWLLSKVERPVMTLDDTIATVTEEQFDWEELGDGSYAIGRHLSQGTELAVSQDPLGPYGIMSWTENGEELTMRFEEGRPVECQAGNCGAFGSPRALMPSVENNRYLLGIARSTRPDGSVVLRDFDEQGHVVLLADVYPVSGQVPAMERRVEGGVEAVTFTGVAEVRRVQRSYTTADDPARVIAVATRAAYQTSAAILFPSDAAVPSSWAFSGVAASRPVVTNFATLRGDPHFFDVDVFDADTDGDGKLNETGEALVIWRHHSLTDHEGRRVYRSERETRTAAGQLLSQTSYATRRGGGPMLVVGKTERSFFEADESRPRERGRLSSVKLFPNAGSGEGAFHAWIACQDGYDREGRLTCRYDEERDPRDPDWFATTTEREELTVPENGVQRRTRTVRAAQTSLAPPAPPTFEKRLASGLVIASGTITGNSTEYRVSGDALATQGTRPNRVLLLDAADTTVRRETLTYGPTGRLDRRSVAAGPPPAVSDRLSSFSYDSEGRLDDETSYADPSNLGRPSRTQWEYGESSDLLLSVTEPDGTLVENIYQDGRLSEVKRAGNLVAGYSYDAEGRITEARNAEVPVLRMHYGEGGALVREENLAAGFVVEHEEDIAVLGSDAHRVMRTTHRSPPPESAVRQDVETYFDNLGRVMMICDAIADPLCDEPLAEYVYGGKRGYAGVYTTASGRTVNLSDAFDHGRLSYVTHPAGATFFVYDAAGRVVTRVQHEGALPVTPPARGAMMRAIDYSYGPDGTLVQMRYPSNRVVQYVYGEDKRAPVRVRLATQTSAPQLPFELVRDIEVDVDGMPASWTWRPTGGAQGVVTIAKDGLGRINFMEAGMSGRERIAFLYAFDEDGDVTTQWDYGVKKTLPGGVDTVPYREHDYRDLLTRWYGFVPWAAGVASDIKVEVDELGRRRRMTSEPLTDGAEIEVSFNYHPIWPERLVSVRRLGTSPIPTLATVASFGYDDLGQVTSVAYGLQRAQTLEYGPRGNVVLTTNASGTSEHIYTDTMERWRRNGPVLGFAQRFRYGVGGELLDDQRHGRSVRQPLARTWARDEFVYLGGRKIAAIHSELNKNPQVSLLFTDRLGTVRKMTTMDLKPLAHIDTDAWGNGVTRDERSTPNVGQIPNVGERLPGQYSDGGRGFTPLENHWRFYLPWTGAYLSPDAEYRASGGTGAQAYAYASGRPLVMMDPSGRAPSDVPIILRWFNDIVDEMGAMGVRLENPYVNNIAATFQGFSTTPLALWGCGEQAGYTRDGLEQRQSTTRALKDRWDFDVDWRFEGIIHQFVNGRSVKRCDPLLFLDPWRREVEVVPSRTRCSGGCE